MRHMMYAAVFAILTLAAGANAQAAASGLCPSSQRHRPAAEVLESHRTALATGDWAAVGCNYAADAVVISDQGVISGRDNIVAALQQLSGFLGGTIPMVNQEVIVTILGDRAEMVRVLFSVTTQCVDIPDGADTYVVKSGRIQAQTAHGFPVFKCPPPAG